jgi:ribosomal protein S18 acetylase RimI-like enzyme
MITYEKISIEDFIPLFQINYGKKHNDCYMLPADTWAEVAKWRKDAYVFKKDGHCIGGVLQPDNIITGLFTIAPYNDYAKLLEVLLEQLEEKEYVFYEIPDCNSIYYQEGFILERSEVLMYMRTDKIELSLVEGYTSSLIEEKDSEEIGRMLHKAFLNDKVYKHVDPVEEFINSAKGFFDHVKGHDNLYKATKKIQDQDGHIVGAILTMMDAGHPFAYNLAVDPDHQKKGLGKYLLGSLVNDLKDYYDTVRLYVHTNNPIRRMYESIGFQYGVPINTYSFKK